METAPVQPALATVGLAALPAISSAMMPTAGRTNLNKVFQMPLTSVMTTIARLPKPQPLVIANDTATPTAPPNGSRLLTALPAALSVSPCRLLSPGRELVSTNV